MRNMPITLSATPSQSKRWGCFSRLGTLRTTARNATTPTGRLMKKIHSHPSVSIRMPPRTGPTSDAMPATAPQMPIAVPRRSGGKMRVMTAIVWGVIIDAPSPCTARATMSISIEEDSPQASDESVNTVRPTR